MTARHWGESLMGRSVGPLLEMAGENGVSVAITTNGTLFTEQKCRMLVEKGVAHVCVSLDAGTPEGFARLRPGGVPFERVIEGIHRLARIRTELRSSTPDISAAMVYMDDSADELEPLLRLATQLPVSRVTLQVLYFSDFDPGAKDYRLSTKSVALLDKGRDLARELGVELVVDMPEQMDFDTGVRDAANDAFRSFPSADRMR